jgi:hypothetical protein
LKNLNIVFGNSAWFCTFAPGELAEWSIAAVLKTVELLKVPGVRIPNSPLNSISKQIEACKSNDCRLLFFGQKPIFANNRKIRVHISVSHLGQKSFTYIVLLL